jgi:perosamine synthetase
MSEKRFEHVKFWEPVLGEDEKRAVCSVIDSGFVNDGPLTKQFEQEFARFYDVPYAVATTSGTAAIFLALSALGIGRDDEVIVPNLTFAATANAVTLAGGHPVLVDVDSPGLGISAHAVERAVTAKTKAIVPVHVSGRAANIAAVLDVAQRRNLMVIEDAAEALGSRHAGRLLGTFGDAGCFSLTANKTITAGQGGIVITSDATVYRRLRELKDQGRPVRGTGGDDEHPALGFNFKFTDIQAAVALVQLQSLPARVARLKQIYRLYREELLGCERFRLFEFHVDSGEIPQWVDAYTQDRPSLCSTLDDFGIQYRKYWHPLHTHASYRCDGSPFPVSIKASSQSLWLPSSLKATDEDLRAICRVIREWDRR